MRKAKTLSFAFLLAGCALLTAMGLHSLESDGAGPSAGGGAASGGGAWVCHGTVYLRARNASEVDFDSVALGGIEFGSLKSGTLSEYRQVSGCDSLMSIAVSSGGRRFSSVPFEQLAPPLAAGYYTSELTAESGDSFIVRSKRVSP